MTTLTKHQKDVKEDKALHRTLSREDIHKHNEQVLKELAEFNDANSNKNHAAYIEMRESIDQLNLLVNVSAPQTPTDIAVKRVNEAFRIINSL